MMIDGELMSITESRYYEKGKRAMDAEIAALRATNAKLLAACKDVKTYLEINNGTGRIIYKPICVAIAEAERT